MLKWIYIAPNHEINPQSYLKKTIYEINIFLLQIKEFRKLTNCYRNKHNFINL